MSACWRINERLDYRPLYDQRGWTVELGVEVLEQRRLTSPF
jgi:hypothetical protein